MGCEYVWIEQGQQYRWQKCFAVHNSKVTTPFCLHFHRRIPKVSSRVSSNPAAQKVRKQHQLQHIDEMPYDVCPALLTDADEFVLLFDKLEKAPTVCFNVFIALLLSPSKEERIGSRWTVERVVEDHIVMTHALRMLALSSSEWRINVLH